MNALTLAYGEHGFYIGLAYFVGALVFALLCIEPWWRQRQLRKKIIAEYRRMAMESESL